MNEIIITLQDEILHRGKVRKTTNTRRRKHRLTARNEKESAWKAAKKDLPIRPKRKKREREIELEHRYPSSVRKLKQVEEEEKWSNGRNNKRLTKKTKLAFRSKHEVI